ncbi:hypothetical protein [Gordonia zhaorongruii]|uniref:hypothetical protein n=1 Tax=Gordonia zhaorongruii TaxID=2597659 RepID=UPI00117E3AC7|nr:hypothetical protein [Gordonia zhaorongruii]
MVRPDHENGEVLKPESDGPKKETSSVQRSSPLSRRRKGTRPGPETPAAAEPAADDSAADDSAVDGNADGSSVDDTAAEHAADDAAKTSTADTSAADASSAADADTASTEDADSASADDRQREVRYRERRTSVKAKAPVGKGSSAPGKLLPALAVSLAALVLIGAIVATVIFTVLSSRIDDKRDLRAEYNQFAQEAIVTMTTLNPKNADKLQAFAKEHTSGRAQQQMRDSIKQAAELIRKDNMKTETTIAASAAEKVEADSGSVLIVFAWKATAPEDPEHPDVQTFRARVDMTRINGELKMTNLEWVN